MKIRIVVLAVVAVLAAGCGGSTGSPSFSSTSSSTGPSSSPGTAAVSCRAQYKAWRNAPAGAALKGDLRTLEAQGRVDDIPGMRSALVKAGRAARSVAAMPSCADPTGYWAQIATRLKAAGDNAGSASGLSGLLLAEAPLKSLPKIEHKLSAELKHTTGKS